MNKALLLLSLLFTSITYGQNNDRITLKGKAKLLSTWSWKSDKPASSILTSGDKLTVKLKTQAGIEVIVSHNNINKSLITLSESEDLFIQCFEYDFDNDGNSEIIIAASQELATLNIFVFKNSKGLIELVGSFGSTYEIDLDKNVIYLPMGSQGLGSEFIYRNGAFYELIYHEPKLN